MDTYAQQQIREHLESGYSSNRMKCPFCSDGRKNKHDKSLSITIEDDKALYMCHHCEESGFVKLSNVMNISELESSSNYADKYIAAELKEESKKVKSLSGRSSKEISQVMNFTGSGGLTEKQLEFLLSRGISEDTAIACGLINSHVYVSKRKDSYDCIGFPYFNMDGSVAVKWRNRYKDFTQTGSARCLWRVQDFEGGDLIITEGEMDAASFQEIGVFATSAPNGASSKLTRKEDALKESKKFSYLWDAKDEIDLADRVIIATDKDEPGQILGEEIARRIGKAKCWTVSYPDGCKDANEVLVKLGKEALQEVLDNMTPWPIGGLREASEYKEEAMSLFRDGMDRGVSTGISELDKLFRPSPHTLVICTGIPGSGKTTFLNWMMTKLAEREGWPCAVFAAETSSQVHLLQLASLYAKKPFRGPNKMTEQELSDAIDWVSDRFVYLDEADTTIESVIERAQAAVLRNGVRVLMIDPYNFITSDSGDDGGHQSINKLLVSLKGFAVEHGISVWLIAHPTKMYRNAEGSVPIPGGYDISGSAAFFNVADNGITVSWIGEGLSKVTSWKSRFPWIGKTGNVDLNFNPEVGDFSMHTEWGDMDEDWQL